MFKLPLNKVTIPRLSGDSQGEVLFNTAADIVEGVPFDEQIGRGPDSLIEVEFDLPGDKAMQLGSSASATFSAETEAKLHVIWEGETDKAKKALLEDYKLTPPDADHVYLLLKATGKADASASANFPAGPFQFGLQADAGGDVAYVHAQPFLKNTPADEVFKAFLKGTRLPYAVETKETVPEPGEVLAFEYGGYLSVGASAGWGYSVSKYAETQQGRLNLESKLDIVSSLKLEGGVKLAGDYEVVVRRGQATNWARVTVKKKRSRAFTFSGNLNVGMTVDTKGIPDDADQFLEAVLDLRTPQVINDVRDLLDDPDKFFEKIKAEKDALIQKFVGDLSEHVLERAFTSATAAPLFEGIREIVAFYDKLDDKAKAALEAVVEQQENIGASLDSVLDKVEQTINPILNAANLDALKAIDNPIVWDFLKKYVGEDWVDFITNEDKFAAVRKKLEAFADGKMKKVVGFVHTRFESLGIKKLLGDLREQVDHLRTFRNPKDAVKEVEKHLIALGERMTDDVLDQIKKRRKLKRAIDRLDEVLDDVDDFKEVLYAKFKRAINGSHKLEIAYTFSRAKENEALVDVEFDLEKEQGQKLMRNALRCNFDDLFEEKNLAVMVLHSGKFTHRTTTESHLKLDLFGWTKSSFRKLVVETEETIRQEGNSLLHIYAMTANEEVSRTARGEAIKMNFMLGLLAEGKDEDLIDTVKRMSAGYTIGVEDSKTKERELLRYLSLAGELGLLPEPPRAILASFRKEMGKTSTDRDWGKVSLKYEVHYPPDALLPALKEPSKGQLTFTTRTTLSRIMGGLYWSYFQEGEDRDGFGGSMAHRRTALLLLDKDARDRLRKKGQNFYFSNEGFCAPIAGKNICIEAGSESTKMANRLAKAPFLSYFKAEKGMQTELIDLHDLLKAGSTTVDALKDSFEDLANQRHELEKAVPKRQRDRFPNPFFAVLDQLIRNRSDAGAKQSTLELTFHRKKDGKDANIIKIYAS